MNAIERQEQIINILNENYESISGTDLAKRLSVSRQIIVTDIAILRAKGFDITSTTKYARGFLKFIMTRRLVRKNLVFLQIMVQ